MSTIVSMWEKFFLVFNNFGGKFTIAAQTVIIESRLEFIVNEITPLKIPNDFKLQIILDMDSFCCHSPCHR